MLDTAVGERDRVAVAWEGAAERLRSLDLGDLVLPDLLTPNGLSDVEQQVRARATRLEALLPREQELRAAEQSLASAEAEVDAATQARAAAQQRLDAIPDALDEARALVTRLTSEARKADTLTLELRNAGQRLGAAREADACVDSLVALRDAEREARDLAADARDHVQDLAARRLAGIAAELAGRLEDGQACQVCGSTEHPRPAEPSDGAVTEAEQADAVAVHEARNAAYLAASGKVLQAEERLEALRAASSHQTVAEAELAADKVGEQLRLARQAEVELQEAERSVEALTVEQQDLTTSVHEVTTRLATTTQALSAHRETIASLSAEIAAATGSDGGAPAAETSLSEQVSRLGALAVSLATARETLCDHDAAVSRVTELATHAESSAAEHDFPDVAALRAAVLDASERARLEEALAERAQAATRASAVLEDPEVLAVADQAPPDLPALTGRLATAEEQEASAARVLHHREEVVGALRRQRMRLEQALEDWGPVREEYQRADSMARLVRGMGGDNQLQMRLSAYVLATRLDQVVAAANERLAHMRDQRYLLQRTGKAARKGSQAGLGLEVVDQWTGDVRDPATLSGGETFVVSLSLALGLADVVTQEAGGTEIETLFVDEGFGTLDADTLDDVMDRLDELRAGGRAVGVVSHVSELRNRIPTQLHVEKRRNGSTVAVRTAVG
jgi:exonuclease SbcC